MSSNRGFELLPVTCIEVQVWKQMYGNEKRHANLISDAGERMRNELEARKTEPRLLVIIGATATGFAEKASMQSLMRSRPTTRNGLCRLAVVKGSTRLHSN